MESEVRNQAKSSTQEKDAGWLEHEKWKKELRVRSEEGKVVIKAKDQPVELGAQGYNRWILAPWMKDTTNNIMYFHSQLIPKQSGRHVHQGGIGLFVLEGEGYSIVDGVRYDWKAGDMVLLPVKKGGCEHQHFNLDHSKPSKWLRVGPLYAQELLGGYVHQKELSPAYKEKYGNEIVNP